MSRNARSQQKANGVRDADVPLSLDVLDGRNSPFRMALIGNYRVSATRGAYMSAQACEFGLGITRREHIRKWKEGLVHKVTISAKSPARL